jgi:hypothetical protein
MNIGVVCPLFVRKSGIVAHVWRRGPHYLLGLGWCPLWCSMPRVVLALYVWLSMYAPYILSVDACLGYCYKFM